MIMQNRQPVASDLQFHACVIKSYCDARIMPDLLDFVRSQIGMEAQTALIGIESPQHNNARQWPAIKPE